MVRRAAAASVGTRSELHVNVKGVPAVLWGRGHRQGLMLEDPRHLRVNGTEHRLLCQKYLAEQLMGLCMDMCRTLRNVLEH